MSKTVEYEYYNEYERNICFNDNWIFSLDNEDTNKNPHIDTESFSKVTLPHDWSIEFDFNQNSLSQNEAGFLDGGIGWYRKEFILGEDILDSTVIIRFGGVYMDSRVYVNGSFVGNMPNGYIPFSYDISPFLYRDERINTIAIKVINKQPSSRWYSGSGIYRDVQINILEDHHFIHDSVVIKYNQVNEEIITNITYALNKEPDNHQIRMRVFEKNGKLVYEESSSSKDKLDFNLVNPKLWSCETPNLYTLHLDLYHNKNLIDSIQVQYGYRFLHWSSNEGFYLNDENIKLKGVCLHHDNGALGAVASYDAIYRKLSILKEMGVNAIRSSHNPCDDHTIDIAEEIGLMVIDEAFDTWFKGKKKYDYGRFFNKQSTHPDARKGETWAEFDIKAMVRRGINSPAIIMWSIGNEINESNNASSKALETTRNLNKWIKEIDDTRFTTMGQDVYRWAPVGVHEQISEIIDAVGLNYAESSFETIREKHPDWLIYGSETSSGTRSRGEYAFPDEVRVHDNNKNRNYQQSDYGNDHVAWGSSVEYCIKFDNQKKDYAGQFYWTGFDYIGEPTPWHNQNDTTAKSSYFGLVDTCGFPKNDYYLLQSQWIQKPVLHIYPHWNWDHIPELMITNDNMIPIRVASNQPFVELFINNESLGIIENCDEKVYREWRAPYIRGTIKAKAYDNNMEETCERTITTAERTVKIDIKKDKYSGKELDYLLISAQDSNSIFNPFAQNELHFSIDGEAEIVGVDNGNPSSLERYKKSHNDVWKRCFFNGKALVIVKKHSKHACYQITATSSNLQTTVFNSQSNLEIQENETRNTRLIAYKIANTFFRVDNIKKIHTYNLFLEINETQKDSYNVIVEFNDKTMGLYSFTPEYKINTSYVHTGTINATIHQLGIKIELDYSVEGMIAIDNFNYCVVDSENITFPDHVNIYHSDYSASTVSVEWKKITSSRYLGIMENSSLKSELNVRETDKRTDGVNFSQIWTGSQLPIAFSNKASDNDVARINNGDYTLANPYHLNHSVGIIFGDSGDFTSKYVDNIVIKTNSVDSKEDISIFYCSDVIKELPTSQNYSDLFINYEWTEFSNIKMAYNESSAELRLDFDGKMSYGICIKAKNLDIYQVSTYEAIPVPKAPSFIIHNGDQIISSQSMDKREYTLLGEIVVIPESHCTYTMLEYQDKTNVLIHSENSSEPIVITLLRE